jgi:hypothetical protein
MNKIPNFLLMSKKLIKIWRKSETCYSWASIIASFSMPALSDSIKRGKVSSKLYFGRISFLFRIHTHPLQFIFGIPTMIHSKITRDSSYPCARGRAKFIEP